MTGRRFSAVVPAVSEAVAWARARADEARLPEARGLDLELAAEEALMNVCLHAYGGQGGEVALRAERTGEGFVLEIEDSGPPFDPLSAEAPDTTLPLEAREIGGLGILLVRRVTDQVRWRREKGRNVLTLVFALPGAGEGREDRCSSH
ncbi:MAG: ATP-binding protein [Holophagales bacterium]|nr:ATP-binding protein [Holophagales bacterium]